MDYKCPYSLLSLIYSFTNGQDVIVNIYFICTEDSIDARREDVKDSSIVKGDGVADSAVKE